MRIVVDSVGRYVDIAWTGVVLQPGQRIVELSPADVDKLLAGARWESMQQVLDVNRAWRESPRAETVLNLPADATGNAALARYRDQLNVEQAAATNLLRNILQDLIRVTQRQARQLNTLIRAVQTRTELGLVIEGDDDFGPGA